MFLYLFILFTLGSCVETVYNTSITSSGFVVKYSDIHVRLYHYENPNKVRPFNVDGFDSLAYVTVVQYSSGAEKELFFVAHGRANNKHLIRVYNLDEVAFTVEYKMSFILDIPIEKNFTIYSISMPLKDTCFITGKLTGSDPSDKICVAKLSLCNGRWSLVTAQNELPHSTIASVVVINGGLYVSVLRTISKHLGGFTTRFDLESLEESNTFSSPVPIILISSSPNCIDSDATLFGLYSHSVATMIYEKDEIDYDNSFENHGYFFDLYESDIRGSFYIDNTLFCLYKRAPDCNRSGFIGFEFINGDINVKLYRGNPLENYCDCAFQFFPDTRTLAFFESGDVLSSSLTIFELTPEYLQDMDIKYLVATNYCPSETEASKENAYNSAIQFTNDMALRMGESLVYPEVFRQAWFELASFIDMNLWSIRLKKRIDDPDPLDPEEIEEVDKIATLLLSRCGRISRGDL